MWISINDGWERALRIVNGYTRLHYGIFYRQATKRAFWDKMSAVVGAEAKNRNEDKKQKAR